MLLLTGGALHGTDFPGYARCQQMSNTLLEFCEGAVHCPNKTLTEHHKKWRPSKHRAQPIS